MSDVLSNLVGEEVEFTREDGEKALAEIVGLNVGGWCLTVVFKEAMKEKIEENVHYTAREVGEIISFNEWDKMRLTRFSKRD